VSANRREADLDCQSTGYLCRCCDGRLMGGGDCLDDRGSKANAVAVVGALGAEALEGLGEPVEVRGWNGAAAVCHRENRPPVGPHNWYLHQSRHTEAQTRSTSTLTTHKLRSGGVTSA
jgi:hypothetical protein